MRKALHLTLLAAATALVGTAVPASAAPAGLTAASLAAGGKKVTTYSVDSGDAAKSVKLSGLVGDDRLVGLDYRSFDGLLYGVGDSSGLYLVDPVTGAVEKVGVLSVPLDGSSFGVDFNPAANALRVISDTGQNLRQPFASVVDADRTSTAATIVDGGLNYGGRLVDGSANTSTGGTPALGVTGAGYTNNDADSVLGAVAPTGTALYDIDTTRDLLVLADANRGILTEVGALGFDVGSVAGFDVYSGLTNGKATSNTALALLEVAGESAAYEIDLTTGAATRLTSVTGGARDIAVKP